MKKRDELKRDIPTLINRLRTHAAETITAAYELDNACRAIEEMNDVDISKLSPSDVEPKKELFEYYVVDALSGHRAIGVVQAVGINEATEIMKNSIKPNRFCVTHVHKLEFNDKGFCDIYSGF